MHRALLSLTLLTSLLALPACWSHHAPRRTLATQHAAAPAPLAPDAWPPRLKEPLQKIYDDTPEKIFRYRLTEGADPEALTETERKQIETPEYTITYKGFHANALLRIYATPQDSGQEPSDESLAGFQQFFDSLLVGFIPNAYILSSRTLEAKARADALDQKTRVPVPEIASEIKPSPKPPPHLEYIGSAWRCLLDEGLPLRIPVVAATRPKGLVIHLQSLAGNQFEPKVLREFANRGWAIIDIKTQTNIRSPVPDEWCEEIVKLAIEERELAKELFSLPDEDMTREKLAEHQRQTRLHPNFKRWQDIQTRRAKLRQGGFDASREEDLEPIAATIAAELDQALAGAAYAVEAVLDYVDTQRPDLQDIPVVMLGFSAGALATPTAAARIEAISPGRISAIALVGGGCNLFRLSQESSFTDGGLKIRVGEQRAPKATIDKLGDLYLKASKLDPYYTAPLIAHLPILQVHASTDTWVPAACGDLLYERLNYPERLVMSGDHDYLFYFLPKRAKWIADWTERAAMTTKQP